MVAHLQVSDTLEVSIHNVHIIISITNNSTISIDRCLRYSADFNEATIPKSASFQLISNSCQRISSITSRLLLTYEKIGEPHADMTDGEPLEQCDEFRTKFFTSGEECRQERRAKRAELREVGRLEALKRGRLPSRNTKEHKIEVNKKRFE